MHIISNNDNCTLGYYKKFPLYCKILFILLIWLIFYYPVTAIPNPSLYILMNYSIISSTPFNKLLPYPKPSSNQNTLFLYIDSDYTLMEVLVFSLTLASLRVKILYKSPPPNTHTEYIFFDISIEFSSVLYVIVYSISSSPCPLWSNLRIFPFYECPLSNNVLIAITFNTNVSSDSLENLTWS